MGSSSLLECVSLLAWAWQLRFGHMQVCRPSLRIIDFPLPISYVAGVLFTL